MANNLERYQQIKQEAHNAIEVGYNQAILNYQQQKNAFLTQLNLEKEDIVKEMFKNINDQIYDQENEDFDKKLNEIFTKTKNYLEEVIVKILDEKEDDLKNIKQKLNDFKSSKKPEEQLKYLSRILKEEIEKSLSQNGFSRLSLIKYLQQNGIELGGKNNKALQDNLFGYLRRLIIQRYTSNTNIKNVNINLNNYKQSLKGYLQEEAIEEAISKVLENYGYVAKQTGAIESDTGQEIIYDLVIAPKNIKNLDNEGLKSIIKKMDSFQNISVQGTSTLNEDNIFLGGVQSKSWIISESYTSHFISFGIHSDLIPEGDKKYYWHGGVSSLMYRMNEVIGRNNFMFATGSNLQFTVDLLCKLKERNYVLNFHKSKNKAISNPHVYADIHFDTD